MPKKGREAHRLFGLAIDYRKIASLMVALAVIVLIIVFRIPVVSALFPFFLALVLANVLDPIVARLQRRVRLPRAVATMLTLGLVLLTVGYGALWMLNNLYREVVELTTTLPAQQKMITRLAVELTERAQEIFDEIPAEVTSFIREYIDGLTRSGLEFIGALANNFIGSIASFPVVLVTAVITMLATYFFTTDKDVVDTNLLRIVPMRLRPTLADVRDKILIDLVGFFKAQFVLFFINTALAALWLFLSGARYWMLMSLSLGILDVIPVLGPGLVLVPWAGINLWQGSTGLAVSLIALFAAMFGVRQVLQAKILGDSIGIHPLLMLFALWTGIVIFGVWGFLIGPVIVIFGKAIWNTGAIPYFRDEEPEPVTPPPPTKEA